MLDHRRYLKHDVHLNTRITTVTAAALIMSSTLKIQHCLKFICLQNIEPCLSFTVLGHGGEEELYHWSGHDVTRRLHKQHKYSITVADIPAAQIHCEVYWSKFVSLIMSGIN